MKLGISSAKIITWKWRLLVDMLVFADEMPNFIIDYELKIWVYKELVIYIFWD